MILNQTEIETLFGSEVCLLNILKLVNGKSDKIKHIVLYDDVSSDLQDLAKDMGIEIISYHDHSKLNLNNSYLIKQIF